MTPLGLCGVGGLSYLSPLSVPKSHGYKSMTLLSTQEQLGKHRFSLDSPTIQSGLGIILETTESKWWIRSTRKTAKVCPTTFDLCCKPWALTTDLMVLLNLFISLSSLRVTPTSPKICKEGFAGRPYSQSLQTNIELSIRKTYERILMISRVVFTVTGSNQSRKHGSPFIHRKVFRMSMSGPNAFKNDLVLGLIAGTTGLYYSWFRQRPIIFTHVISQATIILVPNVLPFHYHGLEINAPWASRRRSPINLGWEKNGGCWAWKNKFCRLLYSTVISDLIMALLLSTACEHRWENLVIASPAISWKVPREVGLWIAVLPKAGSATNRKPWNLATFSSRTPWGQN